MGRFIARSVSFAVPFLFLFTGLAVAQTTSLEGKVIGQDGKPLEGALVKIERKDIKANYKVKTKRKGEWFHARPAAGHVSDCTRGEWQGCRRVGQCANPPGESTPVNFDLAQRLKEQQALQAAAATGTLTAEQARSLTAEQRAELEKALKERQAELGKQKGLNEAFNAGMEAMKAKQYDAAIEGFTKASELDPKQHVVWAQLGRPTALRLCRRPAPSKMPPWARPSIASRRPWN